MKYMCVHVCVYESNGERRKGEKEREREKEKARITQRERGRTTQ
jgi:hypothetical protein